MSGWKANLFSIGGRLTLIKSMLRSLGGLDVGSLKAFNKAILLKWRWPLFQNLNALWVHMVKAIQGDEAGVDLRGCQTNGVWASIVETINHLHSSGIVPLNSIRFKDWDWSRPIIMGRTKTEFDNLILDIASLESNEIVGSDSLPNRLNLSSRGLDLDSISCMVCNGSIESNTHTFFTCDIATSVWRLVRSWTVFRSQPFARMKTVTFGLLRDTLLRTRILVLIPSSWLLVGTFALCLGSGWKKEKSEVLCAR
ncbi:RNA-directed DNA polymerase, eukaryota, reverse transcriptase zinc-binding domain protein [Tanacetum coccineum]